MPDTWEELVKLQRIVLTIAVCFIVLLLVVDIGLVVNRQAMANRQRSLVASMRSEIEYLRKDQEAGLVLNEEGRNQRLALIGVLKQISECKKMSQVDDILAQIGIE